MRDFDINIFGLYFFFCVDNDFCGEAAKAVRFDDPDIKWQTVPWPKAEYILSEKDKRAMRFRELM